MCSQGSSADKESGFYSIFEIIEKLTITELPKPTESGVTVLIERQRFVISSAWMIDAKNGETFDDEFDFEVKVYMEFGDTIMDNSQKFKFTGPEKPAHRLTVNMVGPIPVMKSGSLVVECRVRKSGSSSWKSHSYRVIVEHQRIESIRDLPKPSLK